MAIRRWRLCIGLALAGCDAAAPPARPPLPPPVAAAAPYRIQVGDVLGIRLFYTPELNEDVTVRTDGRITTAVAEAVPAAGRTPEELAATLRADYARELKSPRLTVEVRSPQPVRIYVGGEVPNPGELLTTGPAPSLLQAVARAGGIRPSGDDGAVFVVRRGAADRPIVIRARYDRAVAGHPEDDLALAPYDVVYVPRTGISRVYVWFNQHFQQFVPVSWGFSYNVNPVVNNTR